MTMPTMIGAVSKDRYDELVAETRELFAQDTNIQFKVGDNALEIEPMRLRGARSSPQARTCTPSARPSRRSPTMTGRLMPP